MRNPAPFVLGAFLLSSLCVVSTPAAEVPTDLDALSWLAGHWVRGEGDKRSEEFWLPMSKDLILGMNAVVVDGRARGFEFLRIRLREGKVEYVAMPGGKNETAFEMIELKDRKVVFSNPEHDFPQRILYWMEDDGRLHARIEGEENGESKGIEWFWEKR